MCGFALNMVNCPSNSMSMCLSVECPNNNVVAVFFEFIVTSYKKEKNGSQSETSPKPALINNYLLSCISIDHER